MLTPFYRRIEFAGIAGRAALPTVVPDHVELHGRPGYRRNMILSQFKATLPEYVGVLRGDYIVLANGHALVDRDGGIITINLSGDDIMASKYINEHFISPACQERLLSLLGNWDELPVTGRMAVISHQYAQNFFHFCMETITKLRFLDEFDVKTIAAPASCLRKNFQRDLLARTLREREVLPLTQPFRIRDPVLAHGYMCADGMFWLRRSAGLSTQPGAERYYLRRTKVSRPGDCLVETAEFTRLLDEFGFKGVDFGEGELGRVVNYFNITRNTSLL